MIFKLRKSPKEDWPQKLYVIKTQQYNNTHGSPGWIDTYHISNDPSELASYKEQDVAVYNIEKTGQLIAEVSIK